MRSTFLGFNAARSGLFAAQRALDITGHNIANVNTKGYTRQRLEQAASIPMPLPGGQGMLGTGVSTLAIKQLRSEFLDFKYRDEANSEGYWEAKRDGLHFIESIMNEPSDTGITTVIDQLFASFQQLSKPENADNLTTRALVRQNAITFTNSINHMYDQLENLVRNYNSDVVNIVSSINGHAEQIARLNEQIFRYEVDGSNANDLRDQRNLLIDELSKYVSVEVLEVADSNDHNLGGGAHVGRKMVLQINGQPLVYHNKAYKLDTDIKEKSQFFEDIRVDLEINTVRWESGSALNVSGIDGELKALLNLRDGSSGSNKGIPYYIERLNHFTQVFAEEINKIHSQGYGLDGNDGYLFFTANGVSSEAARDEGAPRITAKNISVALDIEDLNKIAAATEKDLLPGDGSNALKLANTRDNLGMFSEGKPEDFLKSLISNLGVDTQEAMRNAANQAILTAQVDMERQRISGVGQDEELSNMIRFQHAYNASARMITTMDEMLDVIINMVGLVGR